MPGSLRRQLLAGVSIGFLLLLAGVEAIHIAAARRTVQQQLESGTQEAATSLGLALGALLTQGDLTLAETVVNPVFDRGDYERIVLLSIDGAVLVERRLPVSGLGVPAWFAAALPLTAPTAESLVTAGWKQIGRVRVTGHPRAAYQQLWHAAWGSLAWLAAWYAAALAAALAFLRGVLRPLDDIERVAVAIGERDFSAVAALPRARELRHVAEAINALSVKVRRAVEAEGARAEALRREAYQDSLTGLLNRRGFATDFQARMRDAVDIFRGALLLLQFRDFAAYNREAGYARGDAVLEAAGRAVADCAARAGTRAARWSGAAFALALPNAPAAQAEALARELAGALHAALPGADAPARSVGVASFDGPAPELTRLLAAADNAAARAAAQGGEVASVEVTAAAAPLGSGAWRARLERALAEDGFELWVQPVLALPGGAALQREIHARLRGEAGAPPVAAAAFFPMAVRHGLAEAIDRLILERVMSRLERAPHDGEIAVNVSPPSAAAPAFAAWVEERLRAAPAVARRLVFELSESGSARDRAAVQAFAALLRRCGARFALDNFGLHPESIQLMRALLPAYVKLSRAHTAMLPHDEPSRFFVASLVRLGAPLEVRVIAQGVESAAVLPLLEEAGVAGYQGYAVAPPAAWDD
jgi:diguanylate cyclase (GGDEF)-like protein